MRERNLIKKFSEKTNLLGGTFELPNYDALTDSDRRAVYGGVYIIANTTAQTIASGSYVKLTQWNATGEIQHTNPSISEGHIEIKVAGVYNIVLSASFSGTGNVTWDGGVFLNNGTTQLTNIHTERKLGASGDVGSVGMSGNARLAVGDTVEVWFRQQEGTDKEVTIRYCNLALHKIG